MSESTHESRLVFARPPDRLEAKVNVGVARLKQVGSKEWMLTLTDSPMALGPPATIVTLFGGFEGSFFPRDVRAERAIVVVDRGLAITVPGDRRSWQEIIEALGDREPKPDELSFEQASNSCSGMVAPVWLGLGGDARIFLASLSEDHGCWGWVTPFRMHKNLVLNDGERVEWDFTVGRGSQYRHEITRCLEDGALPIVHSRQVEPSIEYDLVMFAASSDGLMMERSPRGTQWQAAYLSCMGCMYDREKQDSLAGLLRSEIFDRDDQPVFCLQVTARNTGRVPAFAWYRMPMYKPNSLPPMYPPFARANEALELDPATGICREDGRIFSVNRLNNRGLPNEEVSVLVEPGESVVFEARLPFVPIPEGGATVLNDHSFKELHEDCRDYWRSRLGTCPRWRLPEPGLDERLRAGVLHLAMNTLGERQRTDSPLLATVGVYAPIGTESTPILWFLDTMGQHETVRRCLDYFFEIQREDGYIQSFNHYDAETGPVLGNVWRHFLLTGDRDWAIRVQDPVRRAARYLIERRRKEMAGQVADSPGYGMISGKTADPDEVYHQFILNAQAADGLAGAAELLKVLGDPCAAEVLDQAVELKAATRRGFDRAWLEAPLVPTEAGDWVPFVGPWPGPSGDVSLYAERDRWFTHGSFHIRAIMALHLVCWKVIDADDPRMAALVRGLEHNVLLDFTGPTQPYGRRTDFYYAATGQVEKFTQLFYRQLASLQDRETYTFWEHYYKLSSQKTHEEAWFLEEITWMLCFEENSGLTLLKMAPSSWFASGRDVVVEAFHTTFGTLAFELKSTPDRLTIEINLQPGPVRSAKRLGVRIPRAIYETADVGRYDPESEILELDPGRTEVLIEIAIQPSSGSGSSRR